MLYSSLIIVLFTSCASEEAVKVYNSAPTVTITSHSEGESFQDGYEVTFQAQVQDDNHETSSLQIQWSSDVRTLCSAQSPTSDGISQCRISLEEGESIVRVQVTDPEDSAAIAEINVLVEPTFAPTVQITSPISQGLYYSDQLLLFSAILQDNEDTPADLSYTWESSLDGVLPASAIPNEDGLLEEYLYLSEGNHALTLSVTDLSGKITERSISLNVGGTNTNPNCSIVSPVSGDYFLAGESITFQATMSDQEIEIDALEVTWISDKDGDLGMGITDSSGEITLATSSLSANSHIIQFVVKDELESTCSDSIVISVGTPPELTLSSPIDGDVVVMGEVVRFEANVLDNEDTPSNIDVSWTSDIDGAFSSMGPNSSGEIEFNATSLSAGVHSITVVATDSSGFTDSELLLLRVNQLPTAPSLDISPQITYTDNDLFANASGTTDADGDTVTYTYQWYKNGSITANTGLFLANSLTTKGELWTARATPNDGYLDGAYTEASTEIMNSPPTIDSLTLDANQATSAQNVTCTGTSSDLDADPLSESYVWMNETTGIVLGSSATLIFSPLSVSPGDSISCSYSVDDGSTSQSQETIISVINTDPTIDSISVVPSTPYLGDILSCIGIVSDEDLESTTETYLWENQTTGTTLSTNSSITIDANNASPNDEISCTFTTNDTSGGSTNDSASAIVGNLSPSIDSLSFNTSSVSIGDEVSCLSSESDPEGDIPTVTYSWTNETTGTQIGSSANITLTSSMATGLDEISCTAIATDTYGATDTETISIFIDETIPEFISDASISPSTGITTNSNLSCTGTATDPDGTSISYDYEWKNGSTTLGTSQSITLSPSSVQPTDVVECIVTATDGAGEQETSTTSVMVGNTAPTLSAISITPTTGIDTNSVLTCSAQVIDADLESLSPTYTWMNGSTLLGTGTTITLTPATAQPDDEIHCSASVTDGYGSTESDSTYIIVENTAPTITSVSITPTISYNDNTLTCSVSATDVDNQTLTTTYEWENTTRGTILGTTASITLDANIASRNEEISCEATVTDPSGDEATDTITVTLSNRPPSAPSVMIVPQTPNLNSTLSCTPSGSIDDDRDSVSYEYAWTVNGGPVLETTASFSSSFVSGDTVYCTVTPTDGIIDGTSTLQSTIINNALPVVSSVELSPDPVYTDQIITATPTYSDPDGDIMSLTYTWSVNATEIQTGSANTLAGSLFIKNDAVSVSVVANDGSDNSAAGLASIIVSNTTPTTPSISIAPAIPIAQEDDLVCSVSTPSTDDDSDSITYDFEWTVDGSDYSSTTTTTTTTTSSTISATTTNATEEWECTVTPNDGTDDGTSTAVSVVIESGWDGPLTFTTCGNIGTTGPTQSECNDEYLSSTLEGLITVSSGIQKWEVPSDGTYQIEAQGAAGGNILGFSDGGKGAQMIGEFELIEGQVLNIVVGQHAHQDLPETNNGRNTGGGGGTFIWIDGESDPILVAGGGGGASNVSTLLATIHGSTGTSGNPGINSDGVSTGNSGGSNGGMGPMTYSYSAGAGAGWTTGAPSESHTSCGYQPQHGGGSNGGFLGGDGGSDGQVCNGVTCEKMSGGFGGGGGASGACTTSGSGGGGGYSGGGVGNDCCSSSGGGGGSYNAGSEQSSSTAYNSGHGTVIIDKP